MEWQVICEHYPQQWLLLEAIKAHSQANKRVLEQLAVIGVVSCCVLARGLVTDKFTSGHDEGTR
jgi:hypothetical protein